MKPAFPTLKTFTPPGTELIRHIYSPAPGQTVLVFGVLQPFSLHAQNASPTPNTDGLWDQITRALGKDGLLDEGWPKAHGEWLAAGACHPPRTHHEQPVAATISVGDLHKQLAVYGERRYGLAGRISAPLPFSSIPLTPENAFGGKGHAANPLGKGLDTSDGAELPNIESPGALIASRGDRPDPAGFGPLPITAPQRAHHLGPHGPDWLKKRWPHLPLETSPLFFQAAPKDQRRDGFWQGGEAVMLRNMHPDDADLVGRVPLLRPRFFVHQTLPDDEVCFAELKVNADTVWLLPGQRLGIVIYRALVRIHTPDARDINGFLAEFETPDQAEQPVEYYVGRCLRAMAPELAQQLPDIEAQQKALASLPNDELLKKVTEQKILFQQMLEARGLDDAAAMQQLLDNPHTRKFGQIIAERNGSLSGFFNEIEHLLRVIDGEAPGTAQKPGHKISLESVLPAAIATAPEAPKAPIPAHSAHEQALRDDSLAARHRQVVINRLGNGQSCSGLDLSQANLAGLNLAGMDFSGALLADANFAGAQLQGADLRGAHLQGARLDAANLAGCQLMQASLGRASFSGANLTGAILDGSDCTGANFSGTDLSGISMRQATLSYAWLNQVKAPRIQAAGADFSHANLEGIDLSRAALDQANFTGARLRRAVLDDASCVSANFTQADLSEVNMVRCDLAGSQSTPGTQWQGANLQKSILNDASWMGASLDGAQMQGIKALNTDLSDSNLRNAQIHDADLRKTVFDRADLGHARLSRSNLMEASFSHADLSHCGLDGSNLYGATFMDTILNGANLRDANLDGTILKLRADA
ncbi:MAG TPA: DUF2169 domain-containing protein [Castellaniella sp.]|nr:DUF2169 domain-containing protein [Castellaniella sp.]